MSMDINSKPSTIVVPTNITVGAWIGNVAAYASGTEKAVVICQIDSRKENKGGKVGSPLALVANEDGTLQLQYKNDRGQVKHAEVSEAAYSQAILRMLVGLRDSVKEVTGVIKTVVEAPLKSEPKEVLVDEPESWEEENLERTRETETAMAQG